MLAGSGSQASIRVDCSGMASRRTLEESDVTFDSMSPRFLTNGSEEQQPEYLEMLQFLFAPLWRLLLCIKTVSPDMDTEESETLEEAQEMYEEGLLSDLLVCATELRILKTAFQPSNCLTAYEEILVSQL